MTAPGSHRTNHSPPGAVAEAAPAGAPHAGKTPEAAASNLAASGQQGIAASATHVGGRARKHDKLFHRALLAHAKLVLLYPALFDLEHPRPLKLDIRKDLRKRHPEIRETVAFQLFKWLTRRRAYLKTCKAGAARWGFDGPEGFVTESQALYSANLHALREARETAREHRSPTSDVGASP